jgi:cyclophilin family peptidyl-prolyl cis-trans isomerase
LQVTFTCKVGATGPIVPRIRDGSGTELASLRLEVPKPQVLISAKQGDVSGSFLVELDANAAPVTVTNFLNLTASGFYANTIFHYVDSSSLIMGGAYLSDLSLKTGVFTAIALESNNGLKNLRGTIAMQRGAAADSATTQFYVNVADNPDRDYKSADSPGYAVFGTVISGMDIVDKIGGVTLVADNTTFPKLPFADVTITSVTRLK